MSTLQLDELIRSELRYFESEAQQKEFLSLRILPIKVTQTWDYGPESHTVVIVAENEHEQIVYCETGFGPAFPWRTQLKGESKLGTDGAWCAYLYECFVSSSLWGRTIPEGFYLAGPSERAT